MAMDKFTTGGPSLIEEGKANELVAWQEMIEAIEVIPAEMGKFIFPGKGQGGKVQFQFTTFEANVCVTPEGGGSKVNRIAVIPGFLKPKDAA